MINTMYNGVNRPVFRYFSQRVGSFESSTTRETQGRMVFVIFSTLQSQRRYGHLRYGFNLQGQAPSEIVLSRE
jgi:hypothetical protein